MHVFGWFHFTADATADVTSHYFSAASVLFLESASHFSFHFVGYFMFVLMKNKRAAIFGSKCPTFLLHDNTMA